MRTLFGVLSLLLVVAVVGFLAKKQIAAVNDLKLPAASATLPAGSAAAAAGGNVQQQSRQLEQQFKAAAEAAVQPARPLPDDDK